MNKLLPIHAPRAVALHGELVLSLRSPAGLGRGLRGVAAEVMAPWLAVGAAGGFSSSYAHPGESTVGTVSPTRGLDAQGSVLLRVQAMDRRAFQVLRSALLCRASRRLLEAGSADASREEEIADRLGLALSGASLRIDDGSAELQQLPGADPREVLPEDLFAPPLHEWACVVLEPQPGELRRCVIEFEQAVDAALLAELDRFLAPWSALLELGGFEQPFDAPGVRRCSSGAVQIYERFSAELVVDHFEASETAWNVLINMIACYSRQRSVASVEIN